MFEIQAMYRPASVEDAIAALNEEENAMLVAGGTDVWVQNREGKHAGLKMIWIGDLPELKGVKREPDGTLVIGAATCFTDLTADPLIQRYLPMLGEAVDQVGSPQIRNVGTIGGNVCNGVTSADSAPSLFALDAVLRLRGRLGERLIPIGEFYTGPGKTVRAHDELLMEIRVSRSSYDQVFGQYLKYGKRNAMEISTLGCAVTVRLDEQAQKLEQIRIAYGVAAPTPIRCPEAETALIGRPANRETALLAADMAVAAISPRTSWRASKEFRVHLAHELCKRATETAIQKAGGKAL